MTTTKTRLHISLSKTEEQFLAMLAKRDQVPRATKAAQLIRLAIETEEDAMLYTIANERAKTAKKFLTHKQVWG